MPDDVIVVEMDCKCVECGKLGTTPCGICLRCVNKAMSGKPMKSAEGRVVQKRFNQLSKGVPDA